MWIEWGDTKMLDIMKSEFYKVVRSKVTLVTALCLFGMVLIQIFAFLYGKFAGGIWGEVLEGTRGVHVFAGFMLSLIHISEPTRPY